ncbi:MAG TPA: type II CAAX endopeptidase family protein [Chloroflexota bacterium]|nr:type II CAAX endopeptidase family protein [Chloroflexota bacterium]
MENRVEPTRKEQTLELLAFLFLIVPSIVIAFFAYGETGASFPLVATATIFRDLALVALIAFFLWRNGEGSWKIGWTTHDLRQNLLLGLVLTPFVIIGAGLLDSLLRSWGLSGPEPGATNFLIPRGPGQIALAFILVIVVAVSEETIFRGYLIARSEGITGSTPFAVLLSTVIFSVGHGYEGTSGLLTVGAMGLVFALLFVWRRSLVAPTVIHFTNDFLGIVLIPLLGFS